MQRFTRNFSVKRPIIFPLSPHVMCIKAQLC